MKAENPRYAASLESFFARIQYELRTDLTEENLDNYVQRWNGVSQRTRTYPENTILIESLQNK